MVSREDTSVVLITGANSGIGFETAKLFATTTTASYHVILACRSPEKGEQALKSIKTLSPPNALSSITLDITDEAAIANAVETVTQKHGVLDVLINNAGVLPRDGSLASQMRAGYEANAIGPALVTEAFRPLMSKSKNPRLVFVSSSIGSITLRLDKGWASYDRDGKAYRMSKAALNMYAACAARDGRAELRVEKGFGKDIRVWVVDPGLVATNLTGAGNVQALRNRGAEDPSSSANTIRSCVEGERDEDQGKLIYKDGVYAW